MIGTSISKLNSGNMFYPSLTICQYGSGSVVFVNEHDTNYTLMRTPDLSDVFLQLTTASPNGPSLVLNRSSVEDRYDHLNQSQEKMRSFLVFYVLSSPLFTAVDYRAPQKGFS